MANRLQVAAVVVLLSEGHTSCPWNPGYILDLYIVFCITLLLLVCFTLLSWRRDRRLRTDTRAPNAKADTVQRCLGKLQFSTK